MLILLSPAKQLNFAPAREALATTRPMLREHIKELAETTRALSHADIKGLMKLSDDLADLNRERFQAFDPDAEEGKAAALAFAGDVYRGLDAAALSDADLQWAQNHLRILSGLYGVLRPLDAIQPYRLEMGTRLKTSRGATLYDFWGDIVADKLKADLKDDKSQAIVNLASAEYAKAARLKSLDARVYTVEFKEEKDGKLRSLMVYAKKARGLMARWIIENRLETPERLQAFNTDGYRYEPRGSSETTLLFTRPQPEKKR